MVSVVFVCLLFDFRSRLHIEVCEKWIAGKSKVVKSALSDWLSLLQEDADSRRDACVRGTRLLLVG